MMKSSRKQAGFGYSESEFGSKAFQQKAVDSIGAIANVKIGESSGRGATGPATANDRAVVVAYLRQRAPASKAPVNEIAADLQWPAARTADALLSAAAVGELVFQKSDAGGTLVVLSSGTVAR